MKRLFFILFLPLMLEASDVNIKIPKVPEVPKVQAIVPVIHIQGEHAKTNEELVKECTSKKVIVFSDHVAPEYKTLQDDPKKMTYVGDIKNERVSAYLHTPLLKLSEVKEILTKNGFTIVSSYKIDKKGLAHSIVFTNDLLVKSASRKERGFAHALRLTLSKKDKIISITNPIYHFKAFMQEEYESSVAIDALKKLRTCFNDLVDSKELVKFRVLERFQFMEGMPRYKDMLIVAKAPNAELAEKARKSKKFLYEQKLANGSTIVGIKLSKRTTKFVKKIGYINAGLLPYPILIENNEAKILDPKYYISVMYPKLKMSQFMKIATVPGAINKEIDRIFR